ncbi:MAG TPA: BatA domain-containing protein, partial [Pirellulales bacterium]|nr:BatA domain-containing protein [Pirellulales bacterium]
MPSFLTGAFAIAGMAAAAGPVLIHLLNRRRHRTLHWAAMDFLREAAQRSRRYLRLRDLLLLVVRTACLLLFGLAMARPYLADSQAGSSIGQPVHAVLVVDNSLSMGYQRLEGTVLAEAKQRARQFIGRLPPGSQISVLPTCGGGFSGDAYRTREDALEALEAIAVVDCQTSAVQALDMAREACQRVSQPAAKRVVFLGDQQAINWPSANLDQQLGQGVDLQVVQVAPDRPENAWVADLRLEDGVADLETNATLVSTVNYQGPAPRKDVQVTLAIDGVPVASKTIDLEPGQSRQVTFTYRFDVATEPGRSVFSSAMVSIPADRLAADDQRSLALPVVAALPVVFVDQWGDEEDPVRNQYGETFRLRRLLAPITSRGDRGRQLVRIRHIRISELSREALEDARLLVIAGVESPQGAVPLVRQYIEQGGRVLLAAGGAFDPAAWNQAAWLDGGGILPLPLEPDLVGVRPDEAPDRVEPFFLNTATLSGEYFHWDHISPEETADLFRQPIFFQAVATDIRPAAFEHLAADLPKPVSPTADPAADWLLWATAAARTADDASSSSPRSPDALRPHTLASFTNNHPALAQRNIGRGKVLLYTSGLGSDWNTLTATNAVIVLDRICRSLLLETLPRRTIETTGRLTLAVDPQERRNRFTLLRPHGAPEPLGIDALGGDAYGLTLDDLLERGNYRVACYRLDGDAEGSQGKLWEIPIAVNGPAPEGDLRTLDRESLAERVGDRGYRWVAQAEPIDVDGAQIRGQDSWRWLMGAVLAGLV